MRPGIRQLVVAAAATGLICAHAGPAAAFYFPGWPGSKLTPPQILIPPDAPIEGNPPSGNKPDPNEPPIVKPTTPPGTGPETEVPVVPEPGTLTAALAGLVALSARWAIRRRA